MASIKRKPVVVDGVRYPTAVSACEAFGFNWTGVRTTMFRQKLNFNEAFDLYRRRAGDQLRGPNYTRADYSQELAGYDETDKLLIPGTGTRKEMSDRAIKSRPLREQNRRDAFDEFLIPTLQK